MRKQVNELYEHTKRTGGSPRFQLTQRAYNNRLILNVTDKNFPDQIIAQYCGNFKDKKELCNEYTVDREHAQQLYIQYMEQNRVQRKNKPMSIKQLLNISI